MLWKNASRLARSWLKRATSRSQTAPGGRQDRDSLAEGRQPVDDALHRWGEGVVAGGLRAARGPDVVELVRQGVGQLCLRNPILSHVHEDGRVAVQVEDETVRPLLDHREEGRAKRQSHGEIGGGPPSRLRNVEELPAGEAERLLPELGSDESEE